MERLEVFEQHLSVSEGLPAGQYGRIGLSFSRSMPSRVYALVEATKNGLYKSDDGGFKWELVNSESQWVTNRPFYFQKISVDTKNENRLELPGLREPASSEKSNWFMIVKLAEDNLSPVTPI